MYLVNDIKHLLNLAKICKVHELLPIGTLAISRIKALQYNMATRQQIDRYSQIAKMNIDDIILFDNWLAGKSKDLSEGDLSTIYIASKSPQLTLLLAEQDIFLPAACDQCNVRYRFWEDYIQEIADERMIKMYELIKAS